MKPGRSVLTWLKARKLQALTAAAQSDQGGGLVYRSVTSSKRTSWSRKALYRVEGVLIGIALFLAVFYLLGWFNP